MVFRISKKTIKKNDLKQKPPTTAVIEGFENLGVSKGGD